ncbi:uncharacterized protein LOC134839151 [Symsagittifera roscoffensis]|uniref:uncharacterized protein LOC134839151 n=1 Tax=Symsagittifera roscoffensis TaxID=84072 RepID=UPI00307BEDC7
MGKIRSFSASQRLSLACFFVELLTFALIGLSFGNGWLMGQIFLDGVETDVWCGIYELCFKTRIGQPPTYRCWFLGRFEVNTGLVQAGRIFLTGSACICWPVLCVTFLHAFGSIKGKLAPQVIAKSILSLCILLGCSLVQAEFERHKYERAWLGWSCASGWLAFVLSFCVTVATGINLGSVQSRADKES